MIRTPLCIGLLAACSFGAAAQDAQHWDFSTDPFAVGGGWTRNHKPPQWTDTNVTWDEANQQVQLKVVDGTGGGMNTPLNVGPGVFDFNAKIITTPGIASCFWTYLEHPYYSGSIWRSPAIAPQISDGPAGAWSTLATSAPTTAAGPATHPRMSSDSLLQQQEHQRSLYHGLAEREAARHRSDRRHPPHLPIRLVCNRRHPHRPHRVLDRRRCSEWRNDDSGLRALRRQGPLLRQPHQDEHGRCGQRLPHGATIAQLRQRLHAGDHRRPGTNARQGLQLERQLVRRIGCDRISQLRRHHEALHSRA